MLALVRRLSWLELARVQLPALLAALAIAELFYKFHKITLDKLDLLVQTGVFRVLPCAVHL